VGHNVSLAIAIIVVMGWNFIANRYWTFNPKRQHVNKEASS
jgi:putative flippase GtrA